MQTQIIYTKNRHAYAQRVGDVLRLKIPHRHKNDQTLIDTLIAKAGHTSDTKKHFQTRTDDQIRIRGEREYLGNIPFDTDTYLKDTLFAYAQLQVEHYCEQLGVTYQSIKIRDAKTRRWSCTHDNNIMLSISLIHYPKEYTDYVIAHECCHIIHKNHSKQFRKQVEAIFPNRKDIRKNLRTKDISPLPW